MRKLLRISSLIINIIILSLFYFVNFYEGYFYFDGFLNYVPFILFSIIYIFSIIEFIKYDGIFKFIFYYFATLLNIGALINDKYFLNSFVLIFSIISLIINIVSVIRINKIKNNTFNVGIYSYKQKYITSSYIVLAINLISVFTLLTIEFNFGLILGSFLILTIIYIIIFTKTDEVRNAIMTLSKDLNFYKFNQKLISLYDLPLHKDSISMINLYRANYLFLVNMEEAINLFNNTVKPKNKRYQFYYDLVLYTIYLNNKEFDKCKEILDNLKLNNKRNIALINTETIFKIYTTDDILDVETVFNKQVFLIDKLLVANDLINYYLKHDDKEKALYYSYFIKKYNTDMILLYENADKAILKYENR